MAKKQDRVGNSFKSREKAVLVDSANNEISSSNPLVCTFSADAKTLDARSPQPIVLADGQFKDINSSNPLIAKVF